MPLPPPAGSIEAPADEDEGAAAAADMVFESGWVGFGGGGGWGVRKKIKRRGEDLKFCKSDIEKDEEKRRVGGSKTGGYVI